ncbi:MAG TPA: serine hydrolase [Candidatus Dormibacteraeota bacterium]|nr:serine hydrolase [Candidatus Dormibacteraeota bacterium]
MIRALLILLTLARGTLSAQQQQTHFDDGYVYDKFVDSYVKRGAFSGTVLVARDGKPVFEIHSTTKPFTAAAIMQLVQQGKA